MKHLDLFSGIGGFSLGLERAGFETVAFCEIDEWCRSQLARNWPGVPIHDDIRTFDGATIGSVDIITGGFPCQDVSSANTSAKGIDGERSGLVFEMLRIIREVRPRWVVFENSPSLRVRGADRILDELEREGYACWPLVVGARHVLAPHRRDRVWIVAYSECTERGTQSEPESAMEGLDGIPPGDGTQTAGGDGDGVVGDFANTGIPGLQGLRSAGRDEAEKSANEPIVAGRDTANMPCVGGASEGGRRREDVHVGAVSSQPADIPDHAHPDSQGQPEQPVNGQVGGSEGIEGVDGEPWGWWNGGPGSHLSMDDGLSKGVARQWLKAYGNSVVPQVVECIGRAILASE